MAQNSEGSTFIIQTCSLKGIVSSLTDARDIIHLERRVGTFVRRADSGMFLHQVLSNRQGRSEMAVCWMGKQTEERFNPKSTHKTT